jgi:hypothetical protein
VVRAGLAARGHGAFLDIDYRGAGCVPARSGAGASTDELRRADALVCVGTKALLRKPWCLFEIATARVYGKCLVVALGGGAQVGGKHSGGGVVGAGVVEALPGDLAELGSGAGAAELVVLGKEGEAFPVAIVF